MRIGYLIDTNKGAYDQALPDREDAAATLEAMIEEGILAEQAGFHSVQIPDRHGRTESYFGGPLNLLTILAHETDKVALGAYCLVNTLYHPMHVAEQCAIIDNISRGRLYMTWGRGFHQGYWDQFGIPAEKMLGRFLDSVRLIDKALESKGERFDWDSEFHQVRNGMLSPNCYQQPRFPFWGGGQLPKAIERCGVYAESYTCDDFPILPAVWEDQAGAYRRKAEEHGKEPFIVLMRNGWVADFWRTHRHLGRVLRLAGGVRDSRARAGPGRVAWRHGSSRCPALRGTRDDDDPHPGRRAQSRLVRATHRRLLPARHRCPVRVHQQLARPAHRIA